MNSRQLMASLARKTLVFIAMMFLLSLIVFYVSRLTPGDPLQSFYGDAMQSMTTTELDAARERPYQRYVSGAIYRKRRPPQIDSAAHEPHRFPQSNGADAEYCTGNIISAEKNHSRRRRSIPRNAEPDSDDRRCLVFRR